MAIRAVVFDAYGTLLDVHSAMERRSKLIGPDWQQISLEWRNKVLEYSWVRSLAGRHIDFWNIAIEALAYVAARHGLRDQGLLDDIMRSYRQLRPYPDVVPTLERLRDMGLPRVILSNGTPAMLNEAVQAAGIGGLLDDVLSIEAVGVYKPDPRVYRLATERFGCEPGQVAFLSANAWDGFGALHFGLRVFRVNRGRLPDEYGLRGKVTELDDLTRLPNLLD